MTNDWEAERQEWLASMSAARNRPVLVETFWDKIAVKLGLFKRLTAENKNLREKLAEMDRACQVAGRYGLAAMGQEDLIARIQTFIDLGKDDAGQYIAYVRLQKQHTGYTKLVDERDAWKRAYEAVAEDWNNFIEPRYRDATAFVDSKLKPKP